MSLLGALGTKPWLQAAEGVPAWGRLPFPAAGVGLAVFLAVVAVLFALLAAAYLMRMTLGDWRPLPDPPILWLNTLALVLASLALQRSRTVLRRGDAQAAWTAFLAGGGLTAAFLAGQLAAWRQIEAAGHLLATNPANTFFYLLTMLHGLHLLGGLVAWGRAARRLRADPEGRAARLAVGLCTTYWHALLVVWLGLFGLLLADNGGWTGPSGLHHGSPAG